MIRLYAAQVNNVYSAPYFPYSVGCLLAYAQTFTAVQSAYEFCGFLYKKEAIEAAIAKIERPDMVAIALYIWNLAWSQQLARAIKEKWPRCVILVGGVSVYDEKTRTLDENRDFDYAIFGEGEGPFADFLIEHAKSKPEYGSVGSLIWRDGEQVVVNKRRAFVDLKALRNPYLDGVFDSIIGMERSWQTTSETNRGCPFRV